MSSSGSILNTLLGLLSTGVSVALGIALLVMGLVHVRRANPNAGFCFAGAGVAVAFGAVVREVLGVFMSFLLGSFFVISQVISLMTVMAAGGLAILGIFLLSSSLKEGR